MRKSETLSTGFPPQSMRLFPNHRNERLTDYAITEIHRSLLSPTTRPDATFDVDDASLFGFLGPNGASKKSVTGMPRTLARKNSGKATVLGYDLEGSSHVVRESGRTKKRIAYAAIKGNIPTWVLTA